MVKLSSLMKNVSMAVNSLADTDVMDNKLLKDAQEPTRRRSLQVKSKNMLLGIESSPKSEHSPV